MATYNRGILSTENGTIGKIQSIDYDTSVSEEMAKDSVGNTIAVEYYDPTTTVNVNVLFDTTATLPQLETIDGNSTTNIQVTIAACPNSAYNAKYFVTNCKLTESNTGYTMASMTLKRFHANTLPAA